MSFSPARLSIARRRRMLNKKQLAELAGVAQHTVVRCEKGENKPKPEHVRAFACALEFPEDFFSGPELDEPEIASFRSYTSMTARIRDAALAAGTIGFMISDWVEERFDLPAIQVPDLHLYKPEHAASVLREEWQLGERPISNMVHLLESKGIRVFSLAENTLKVNAYSTWRKDKPYVFLNRCKSSESSRFDAAHELAHLVLHQDGGMIGREAEDQANKFASAFLMPSADLLAHIPKVDYLNKIISAKLRWRVSAAALVYRLHKLELLSDWKYRDFCIEMATRGWHKNEPDSIDRETSVVWKKVLRALWAERTTQAHIAQALSLPESEVTGLIFGAEVRPADQAPIRGASLRIVSG